MAYYNANRVIKLTRKALGLTQEKLSEGICEVETYSKIENGHRTIRRTTYQKLMEKMGRIVDRRYAVCVSKDGMLLDEKIELERAFKRYDYETAEKYLNILREKVDDNLLTRQYIARVEALVEYYRKRISAEELVARLDATLKMTVPEYEEYLRARKIYPFAKEELLILMNMANVYCAKLENGRSMVLYKYILDCVEEKYLGEPDKTALSIIVRNGISIVHEYRGENREAIEEINRCLECATESDYGYLISPLMTAKAFNILKLAQKEEVDEEYVEEAKRLSQYALFIATARGDMQAASSIKKFYKKNFIK